MDAEEWFHVPGDAAFADQALWDSLPESFPAALDRTLEFLESSRIRATFFVLGWLARKYPKAIRGIAAAGHEVACHGDVHRLVCKLSPVEFAEDLARAKGSIEELVEVAVSGFRAPMWSIPRKKWPYEALARLGFTYSSSRLCILGLGGGDPRPERVSGVWEIPGLAAGRQPLAWPAGGTVALRTLPLPMLARARDAALVKGLPAVFWCHPWEFLPQAPRASGGALFRWSRFAGLRRLPGRLTALVPPGDRTLAPVATHLDGCAGCVHTEH